MAEHKLANYFVSTLGEAQQRCEFLTINDLLDEASNQRPDYPAVGFPVPSAEGEWSSEIFCELLISIVVFYVCGSSRL